MAGRTQLCLQESWASDHGDGGDHRLHGHHGAPPPPLQGEEFTQWWKTVSSLAAHTHVLKG